jgi:hypothetical protein
MTSRSDRLNGYRHQHLLPFVFNAGVRFRLCYERLLPANLKDGNGLTALTTRAVQSRLFHEATSASDAPLDAQTQIGWNVRCAAFW